MGRVRKKPEGVEVELTTEEMYRRVLEQVEAGCGVNEAARAVSDESGYPTITCRDAYYNSIKKMGKVPSDYHQNCRLTKEQEDALISYLYLKLVHAKGMTEANICEIAIKLFDLKPGALRRSWARSFLRRHKEFKRLVSKGKLVRSNGARK